jgi:pimeloyl-ACP methyl ester carboxylesterase
MTNRQVIPGVHVELRITDTAKGKVECDLTESDGPAMMDPYSERAQGVRNDFRQSAAMSPLPFANITCPTLIMHGTRDALAEFSDGVRAHEHIKGAERYWIEGGDHLAFWLSPQAPATQASARAFLHQHIKSGTPTVGH